MLWGRIPLGVDAKSFQQQSPAAFGHPHPQLPYFHPTTPPIPPRPRPLLLTPLTLISNVSRRNRVQWWSRGRGEKYLQSSQEGTSLGGGGGGGGGGAECTSSHSMPTQSGSTPKKLDPDAEQEARCSADGRRAPIQSGAGGCGGNWTVGQHGKAALEAESAGQSQEEDGMRALQALGDSSGSSHSLGKGAAIKLLRLTFSPFLDWRETSRCRVISLRPRSSSPPSPLPLTRQGSCDPRKAARAPGGLCNHRGE